MTSARVRLLLAGLLACVAGRLLANEARRNGGWESLAPLPDSVGFAGMFAGVLDGRLVAAGGSNFPRRPVWLDGEKAFSDRIFVLADPAARWTEHRTRLPAPLASAASAATAAALYWAGGMDAQGCRREAYRMEARGDDFVFSRLPDLPQPLGYAAGVMVAGRFYVIGGVDTPSSKSPLCAVWSLPLDAAPERASWRREPDLPLPARFVAAAGSDGRYVYVFGGIGFDGAGKAVPSASALRLLPTAPAWERLPDLPEPRVGAAAPCALLAGNRLFVAGGYAEVFGGPPREHPGFSPQTLYYEINDARWSAGPKLPVTPVVARDASSDAGPAPMIAAPVVVWRERVVVISGEVRPSVRTPAVLAWPLSSRP